MRGAMHRESGGLSISLLSLSAAYVALCRQKRSIDGILSSLAFPRIRPVHISPACSNSYVLKRFLSILLLVSFSLQCFSTLTLIAGFELNRSYIAQHLCVNRDKPSMHCNGKCFLEKELHKDQQRKHQESENGANRLVLSLFSPDEVLNFTTGLTSSPFTFGGIRRRYYTVPHFNFFHPPCPLS